MIPAAIPSFRSYLLPDGWRWEGDLQVYPGGWQLAASGPPPLGRHRRPSVIGMGATQEEAIRAAVELAGKHKGKT